MFDLGFWELMLIAVIALLVVGPERLPGLARTSGLWLGKLRRFVQSVKQDIDQELAAEELQKTLKQQAAIPELEEIIEETESLVEDVSQLLHPGQNAVENSTEDVEHLTEDKKKGDHDGP